MDCGTLTAIPGKLSGGITGKSSLNVIWRSGRGGDIVDGVEVGAATGLVGVGRFGLGVRNFVAGRMFVGRFGFGVGRFFAGRMVAALPP